MTAANPSRWIAYRYTDPDGGTGLLCASCAPGEFNSPEPVDLDEEQANFLSCEGCNRPFYVVAR